MLFSRDLYMFIMEEGTKNGYDERDLMVLYVTTMGELYKILKSKLLEN